MLFNRKKKAEQLITWSYSLRIDPSKGIVRYDNLFEIMERNKIENIGLIFRSKEHLFEDWNMLTFYVRGTYDNLVAFEKDCVENSVKLTF